MLACMYVCIYIYICSYMCKFTCVYSLSLNVQTHTHTHIYIYIYMHYQLFTACGRASFVLALVLLLSTYVSRCLFPDIELIKNTPARHEVCPCTNVCIAPTYTYSASTVVVLAADAKHKDYISRQVDYGRCTVQER